jgi:hypothetical protein
MEARFRFLWEFCHAKVESIKKLSMLTLLLSLLVLAWGMRTVLQEVAVQKTLGLGFLGGSMAQTLATFCHGIIVCGILYGFTIFYQGALRSPEDGFRAREEQKSIPHGIAWRCLSDHRGGRASPEQPECNSRW